jgi:hypothetical protein
VLEEVSVNSDPVLLALFLSGLISVVLFHIQASINQQTALCAPSSPKLARVMASRR